MIFKEIIAIYLKNRKEPIHSVEKMQLIAG